MPSPTLDLSPLTRSNPATHRFPGARQPRTLKRAEHAWLLTTKGQSYRTRHARTPTASPPQQAGGEA